MAYCSRCGAQNPEDAKYCSKCGSPLTQPGMDFDRQIHQFSQEVENLGRRIDRHMHERERHYDHRFDQPYGIFVPLIGSIIGLLVLLLVIQGLTTITGEGLWPMHIATFLKNYLGFLFVLMLVGGYVSYLSRKYRPFRWVAPLIGGVIFFLMFWLISILLSSLSSDLANPILQTIATQFTFLVLPLTLLVVVLGYVGLFFSHYHDDERPLPPPPRPVMPVQPPTAPGQPPISTPPPTTTWAQPSMPPVPPARLYRSGKERILGGVCGGIAEYFNIDPVIIRVVFVIGMVLSFGVLVLGYILMWILIPRNPDHRW
jgi:phage shock protein C